jgi:pimeloyl-ACP methyl ester carboxylesterase
VVLLVHGFASTLRRNWLETGWMERLARAGWRAVAYDQRGHGESGKRYTPAEYAPEHLAGDAVAVLDAAGVSAAVLMGYSMGARVALEVAISQPSRVRALILSGVGTAFRDFGAPSGDRDIVARALEAQDPSRFPPSVRFYRSFAEQTGQDLAALAACWRRPVRIVRPSDLASLSMPTLIATGDRDDVAGDPAPIAEAIPGAELVRLAGKDHMTAVGAREHWTAVLAFLARLDGRKPV